MGLAGGETESEPDGKVASNPEGRCDNYIRAFPRRRCCFTIDCIVDSVFSSPSNLA